MTTNGPAPYVLIVDDDDDLREALADLLRGEGFEAVVARDGREALDHLTSGAGKPALVLLDLMMPRMTGWQLLEHLCGDPALASIPVCVVSASGTPPPIGARYVLSKPFRIEEVMEVVGRHVAWSE